MRDTRNKVEAHANEKAEAAVNELLHKKLTKKLLQRKPLRRLQQLLRNQRHRVRRKPLMRLQPLRRNQRHRLCNAQPLRY
jgi:hypothetical protein